MAHATLVMLHAAIVAALATLAVTLVILGRRCAADTEWHDHFGRMRRRKPDKTWEYREMTEEEAMDKFSQDAW